MKYSGKILLAVAMICLLFMILAFWLFRLDEAPGLHGDEAWFGIMASSYLNKGIESPLGMTFYTGILQSLISSVTFKHFGIGVWQLRLPGVLLNFLAVLLTIVIFHRHGKHKMLILFMVMLTQSSIFLLYPKIAWEVTSLSYLFLLLECTLFYNLFSQTNPGIKTIFAFLIINLLGAYNHILFAALPMALLAGFTIWIYQNNRVDKYRILVILAVNMVNIFIQILFVKFLIIDFWKLSGAWILVTVISLVYFEVLFLKKVIGFAFPVFEWIRKINLSPVIFNVFLLISVLVFCLFHGVSMSQVLSNTALITTLFSHEFSKPVELIATICGLIMLGSFLFFLIKNIFRKRDNLIEILIASYLGVFCIFTTATSIRYYIIPSVMIFLFLAFELDKKKLNQFLPATVLLSTLTLLVISTTQLTNIYLQSNRKVKPIEVIMGNKTVETSAHFLSARGLILFMSKNKIQQIQCNPLDQYFIGNPISFYKIAHGVNKAKGTRALVQYNYETYGSGFKIKYGRTRKN